jgi:hypothetical protein
MCILYQLLYREGVYLISIKFYKKDSKTNLPNLEGRKNSGEALDDDLDTDLRGQNFYDVRYFPNLLEICKRLHFRKYQQR